MTLGRKCWAQYLVSRALRKFAVPQIANFTTQMQPIATEAMSLCHEVKANCFKNRTFTPGDSCPKQVALFELGFQRENLANAGHWQHYPGF